MPSIEQRARIERKMGKGKDGAHADGRGDRQIGEILLALDNNIISIEDQHYVVVHTLLMSSASFFCTLVASALICLFLLICLCTLLHIRLALSCC